MPARSGINFVTFLRPRFLLLRADMAWEYPKTTLWKRYKSERLPEGVRDMMTGAERFRGPHARQLAQRVLPERCRERLPSLGGE